MKKYLLYIVLIHTFLNAQEVSIEDLLGKIEKKTDLSSKTKLENGGVSTVYKREDLRRMQVKTLKDILKYIPHVGYRENRYGLADPFFMDSGHPFVSSSIRLFVDDQELSIGLYGSGISVYGNVELNFIDHIEIYTGNPTYEFSTEPTVVLVKLYSKNAQKDRGSNLSMQVGWLKDSSFNLYNSNELGHDWSYFAYIANSNEIRQKHKSHDVALSRDIKHSNVFASLHDDNNKVLIDARSVTKDTFIDQSLDATPKDGVMKYETLHIGYNGAYENLSYLIAYDYVHTDTHFSDDETLAMRMYDLIGSLDSDGKSFVVSSELKYKFITEKNKLITGLKHRYKGFKYDSLFKNGEDLPRSGHTNQTIVTAFIENQYSVEKNSIITTGVSASQVRNNASNQDDDLLMYRFGHTYTTQNFVFKSIYSHVELTLDPYLINSIFIVPGKKETTEQNTFLEDIIYRNGNNKYEIFLSLFTTHNQMIPNQYALLYNYSKTMEIRSALLRWEHTYNQFDILSISADYVHFDNVPVVKKREQYKVRVRNLNTYKKFDFFNELLYSRDGFSKENYYDYGAGVIYHIDEDLSASLKATNIFNRAETTSYRRVNPQTLQSQDSLKIAPIDRNVVLSVEYLF